MDLRELKERMDTSRGAEPTAAIPFRVERSELAVQLSFAAPFWAIANNIALLYSGLLNHMRDFGVTPQGIRPDSGDGSLGGFNVNFWILQFGAIVRIRLDGIELNAPTFSVDVDQLEHAFLALDSSLHDAQKDLGYSNYVVTVGIHGRVEGIESKEFLARFTGDVPPGLGDVVGSGAVFYFEGRPPATLLSVSADLSAVVTDGVFLKVHSVFDGSMKPELLRKVAEQHLEQSIKAMGLEVVGK